MKLCNLLHLYGPKSNAAKPRGYKVCQNPAYFIATNRGCTQVNSDKSYTFFDCVYIFRNETQIASAKTTDDTKRATIRLLRSVILSTMNDFLLKMFTFNKLYSFGLGIQYCTCMSLPPDENGEDRN
jgi:hypothetical protein